MPTATVDDLWIYIYEQGEVRTRDLEQRFVKIKHMARGTMYKYKRQLEQEGKIQSKPIHARPSYNVYYVPKKFHKAAAALKLYRQLSPKFFAVNTQKIPWQDAPSDLYLTPVKEKILWQNPDTGAMIVINKIPTGLTDSPHIHPDSNVMAYIFSGEQELPDGTRFSVDGIFNCRPKGELDPGYKISKETTIIAFWDGPRTRIEIDVTHDEFLDASKRFSK